MFLMKKEISLEKEVWEIINYEMSNVPEVSCTWEMLIQFFFVTYWLRLK